MEHFEGVIDDGLVTPPIGKHGEEKYRLISCYASIFAKSMAKNWDCIVYLDLFSGAGRARIKGTGKIINSSALIVLEKEDKFTNYFFNDADPENAKALEERILRNFPNSNAKVFCLDANRDIEKILVELPKAKKGFRVLTFCFIDPFNMDSLKFSTLSTLSKRYMDFLVLIPTDMDAGRNEKKYLRKENKTIDEFVGNSEWRQRWQEAEKSTQTFSRFIVEEFSKSMGSLGFIVPDLDKTKDIKNIKNREIYRLALYSKSPLAEKFWKECVKYTNPQMGLNF